MADEQSTAVAPAAAMLGKSVIPIVNRLQDIIAHLGSESKIELPQVAVVGSQSSGKSSVLEALVGRDFLPRGSDICTRRPLVLQLVQTKRKADDGSDEEWGEFLHLEGKKFFDFNEIRNEIQAETDREAGENKGVSDKQICLKIFSPNVLDIALVDLPGLTKVSVGDQPSDIETQIKNMIMTYIKRPSSLILAVTPANADLANSDALQMAGNADPDGHRTIGVITKLDIMDRGTDARNFLLGKVIPLRLGYVGVVNRSQEDILLNRSVEDALVAEEKFFRSRPVYSDIADRCGVPQLAKKLNQILVQHIKTVLSGLKSRINAALVSVAKEHVSYGEITESKAGQGALLLNILSKYSNAFSSMIEGKDEDMSTSELYGGARIHYIFQHIFVKTLEEVDPCEDLTDEDIRTSIHNATGPRSALFVPEVPFEVLIRRQIARLLDPSLQCARFIYDELIKMSHHCIAKELQRFPVLRKCMDDVIGNFLREGLEPSETMIGHIIEMEMDYINTSHPNFVGGSKAVELALQQIKSARIAASNRKHKDGDLEKAPNSEKSMKSWALIGWQVNGIVPEQGIRPAVDVDKTAPAASNAGSTWGISSIFGGYDNRASVKESSTSKQFHEPVQNMEHNFSMIHLKEPPSVLRPTETHSDQESIEITVTKVLLKSYYDIVRKNIEDSVPKAIMHFLVNHTKRELHNVFIKRLYRENLFEKMLQEPDEISTKRKRTRETLRLLQQAFRTLDETLQELPLEDTSILTQGQIVVLYKIGTGSSLNFGKIGTGSSFNFGRTAFDAVMRYCTSNVKNAYVFPSLVYNVIIGQGYMGDISLSKGHQMFQFQSQYLTDKRFIDLPLKIASLVQKKGKKKVRSASVLNAPTPTEDIDLLAHIALAEKQINIAEKHIISLKNIVQVYKNDLLPSDHGGDKDVGAEVAKNPDVGAEVNAADIKGKGKVGDQDGENADADGDSNDDSDDAESLALQEAIRKSKRVGDSSKSNKN